MREKLPRFIVASPVIVSTVAFFPSVALIFVRALVLRPCQIVLKSRLRSIIWLGVTEGFTAVGEGLGL